MCRKEWNSRICVLVIKILFDVDKDDMYVGGIEAAVVFGPRYECIRIDWKIVLLFRLNKMQPHRGKGAAAVNLMETP